MKLNNAQIDERLDIITSIIAKSRRQLGYNPLPPAELDQWTTDWAEVLMIVPTPELNPCATKAMQSHRSGPFAAWEICQAWEQTQQKKQQNLAFNQSTQVVNGYCCDCGNSGQKRSFKIIKGLEVSGVVPCDCGATGKTDYSRAEDYPNEVRNQLDQAPKGWPLTREEDWLQ